MSLIQKVKSKLSGDFDLRELLKGSIVSFATRVGGIFFGFLFTWLVSHYYGAAALGLLSLSFAVLNIGAILSTLGTDTAIVRFVAGFSSQGKQTMVRQVYLKSLILVLGLCVPISLLIFYFAGPLATVVFNKPHLAHYFQLVSWFIAPMSLLWLNAGALRGMKHIAGFSFLKSASLTFFATLLIVGAAFYSREIHVPVAVRLGGLVISAIISFLWWLKVRPKKGGPEETITYGEIVSTSAPMMVIGSLTMLLNWSVVLILGLYRSEADIGILNVLLKLSALPGIALMAVNSISAPKFAAFHANNNVKKLAKTAHQATKMIMAVSLPLFLALLFFPQLALGIFGEAFEAGKTALIIMVAAKFVNAAFGSVGSILQMTGQQRIVQNIGLSALFVNTALCFLLAPALGLSGIAIAMFVSWTMGNIVSSYYVYKHFGFIPLIFADKLMRS